MLCPYVRMSQMFVYIQVYSQVYIDIYVLISLGGHILGTFYAGKLKVGMQLTPDLKLQLCVLELPLGHALGCG